MLGSTNLIIKASTLLRAQQAHSKAGLISDPVSFPTSQVELVLTSHYALINWHKAYYT